MVHTRVNERIVNPNVHINFISALSPPGAAYGSGEDSEAKELLRALAAQLKPVMKRHGFTVNSFEEYESNRVFLGRNWNNGETVELVLRDHSGRFYPISRLLGVFCHELAHIKHMNHSNLFHALRRQLSSEVAQLQRQGYYGDGYWSAGTRLSDSECISNDGPSSQELPEYTCGGAHTQSRTSALPSRRRRRPRKPVGPSLSTGVQTAKKRKAGTRVRSNTVFGTAGKGSVLDEGIEKGGKGSGFRRQAGSQRAREERALAAERRLNILQGHPPFRQSNSERHEQEADSESETEGDENAGFERVALETDAERLTRMHDIMGEGDLAALRDEEDVIIVSQPGVTFTDTQGKGRKQRETSQPGEWPLGSNDDPQSQTHAQSSFPSSSPLSSVSVGSTPVRSAAVVDSPTNDTQTVPSVPFESKQKRPYSPETGREIGPVRGRRRLEARDNDLPGSELGSEMEHNPSAVPLISETSNIGDRASGSSSYAASSSGLGEAQGPPPLLASATGGPSDYLTAESPQPSFPSLSASSQSLSRGNMVRQEVQQRQREALGMDRPRKLGNAIGTHSPKVGSEWACRTCTLMNTLTSKSCAACETPRRDAPPTEFRAPWSCSTCTYENVSDTQVCAMCERSNA